MPRTNRFILEAVSEVASAQQGLVTAAQLVELGLAHSTLQRRSRQGGPWSRVLPAVYLLSSPPLTPEQRRRAAALYVGAPAAFTGRTALEFYGVTSAERVPAEQVHVLIPHSRRRTSHAFVHVERTKHWPGSRSLGCYDVVPPARAAVDACRRLGRRGDVAAILTEVANQGLAGIAELEAELKRSQRRRSALAREVLAAMAAGPASPAEIDLYQRWNASRLPSALWNVDLIGANGAFIARPDVYLPGPGIVVEVDSLAFHYSRPEWEATMERHARLTALGLLVIHVTPARIRRAWDAVCREILSAVASRQGVQGPALLWRASR